MKYTPRLFKAEMVRAILNGRKTQTRQIVNPQPYMQPLAFEGGGSLLCFHDKKRKDTGLIWPNAKEEIISQCPFGQVGDRLWVRETTNEDVVGSCSYGSYSADGARVLKEGLSAGWWYSKKSCPSIHMPRWASRITLEITDVRVERLQDISEEDAIAEGCDNSKSEAAKAVGWYEKPVRAFSRLWDSIYGNWKDNPWVWVIEFKVIKP